MKNDELNRRDILKAAGGFILASSIGADALARSVPPPDASSLRWGFVGTGAIANHIAGHIATTPLASLTAISSRRIASATEFAGRHNVNLAFDDWKKLCESDEVDAVYVATPTGVREEISIYAARSGKHVLAEKPFASSASVQRIIAACRDNDVAFMDGTRFVHHPRTRVVQRDTLINTGRPMSIASAFHTELLDRSNIRYNPELEPMGAIGDVGWYNMRATVEYLAPVTATRTVSASIRRDEKTGAAIAGAGMIEFDDGSTSVWNCAYDTGAPIIDLSVTGTDGVVSIRNFIRQDPDHSASYLYRRGSGSDAVNEVRRIESDLLSGAAMFESFAQIAAHPAARRKFADATQRTQALLDACWESASNA